MKKLFSAIVVLAIVLCMCMNSFALHTLDRLYVNANVLDESADLSAKRTVNINSGDKIYILGWTTKYGTNVDKVFWTLDGVEKECSDLYYERPDLATVGVISDPAYTEKSGFGNNDDMMELLGVDTLEDGSYKVKIIARYLDGSEEEIRAIDLVVGESSGGEYVLVEGSNDPGYMGIWLDLDGEYAAVEFQINVPFSSISVDRTWASRADHGIPATVVLNLYAYDTDLDITLAGTPLETYTYQTVYDNSPGCTLEFSQQMPAGRYVFQIMTVGENLFGDPMNGSAYLVLDGAWDYDATRLHYINCNPFSLTINAQHTEEESILDDIFWPGYPYVEPDETDEPYVEPDETDEPYVDPGDYSFFHQSFDSIIIDGVLNFDEGDGMAWQKLDNRGRRVGEGDGSIQTIVLRGWTAFDVAIDSYGYRIGNNEPVFDGSFFEETPDILKIIGGQYAERYQIVIPVAEVEGEQEIVAMVKLANGAKVRIEDTAFSFLGIGAYLDPPHYGLNDEGAYIGECFDIYLSIHDNPGIVSLRTAVYFDENDLELVSVEDMGLLEGFVTPSENLTAPYILKWSDALAEENNSADGEIAKLTFRFKKTAWDGPHSLDIRHLEARDVDGNRIDFEGCSNFVYAFKVEIGDADESGTVDDVDAMILRRCLASLDSEALLWADVDHPLGPEMDIDGDGEITVLDAIVLERYLAGWDVVTDISYPAHPVFTPVYQEPDGNSGETTRPALSVTQSSEAMPGETFDVYLSILNNPGILSNRVTLEYNEAVLELVSVSDLGVLNGWTAPSPNKNSPYILRWADSLAEENNYSNGAIAKITFKVKENADPGVYYFGVNHVESRNVDGSKIYLDGCYGTVKVPGPEYIMSDVEGVAGREVEVFLSINRNPGIVSLRNMISYDVNVFELVNVEDLGLLNGYTPPSPDKSAVPYVLRWADALTESDNFANGGIVKLTFRIKDDAEEGDHLIFINHIEAYDKFFNPVEFENTYAVVKIKNYTIGDVNSDGSINDADAIEFERWLAGWVVDVKEDAMDIDQDGEIDEWDPILLRRFLAGWNVTTAILDDAHPEFVPVDTGDELPDEPVDPAFDVNNVTVLPGEEFVITVSMHNNPGVVSNRFKVHFDEDNLELVSVENLGLIGGWTAPSPKKTSPYTIRWADSLAMDNYTDNGDLVSLTFKVKDGAQPGSYTVEIEPVEARNSSGSKVYFDGCEATVKVPGPKYVLSDAEGLVGNTVDVFLSVEKNPGIISLRNMIYFDENVFELVGVEDLGLLEGFTEASPAKDAPYVIRWADSLAEVNNSKNGAIAKLTFKIKEGVEEGLYTISLNHIEARNRALEAYDFDNAYAVIEVTDYVIGDADGDGEVTDWDAIVLNRYLANWDVEIANINALDIDGDKEVTDWDAIVLDRYLANWDVTIGG
ncbi:MAG: hypothetical protein J6112_07020 [Clostridia bacterium]|nr:hypothetical protein [Clostridia bacterium]